MAVTLLQSVMGGWGDGGEGNDLPPPLPPAGVLRGSPNGPALARLPLLAVPEAWGTDVVPAVSMETPDAPVELPIPGAGSRAGTRAGVIQSI